jgi:hypothetical protein
MPYLGMPYLNLSVPESDHREPNVAHEVAEIRDRHPGLAITMKKKRNHRVLYGDDRN